MTQSTNSFLSAFRERRIAMLCNDISTSWHAVLVASANRITPQTTNELITLGRGLVFVALSGARAEAFSLRPMSSLRTSSPPIHDRCASSQEYEYYQSVEAREGVTTGISAFDRALTISILGEQTPDPCGLVKPGHIFPVMVYENGVHKNPTLPAGALRIARLGGYPDAAAYVDLLDLSGNLMRKEEAQTLSRREDIPAIDLSELAKYEATPIVDKSQFINQEALLT